MTTLFWWIYQHQSLVLFTDDAPGYFIDFSKFLMVVVVYFTLLLESWFNRKVVAGIWFELDRVYRAIASPNWARLQRRHFTVVGCFLLYSSFWELSFAYGVTGTARGTNFTITFWLLFTLVHLRQLQILLYTDLLGFCLAELNAQMRWTIELSRAATEYGGPRTDGQICGNLSLLMGVFERFYRLLGLLNRAFGGSLLVIKIINHSFLLTDTYWIVYAIMKGRLLEAMYLQACLSSKIICLLLNAHSNEQIVLECARLRELLHRIDLGWQLRSVRGWHMVHNFLLKLDTVPSFSVNAMSMFKIDYGLMMSVSR
ncbi:uncharacterized protein LOC128270799 [Anopheles cruzii]|uniref:uncharacterized protein LOC128270799 n=1 Tax=Anopheles cruzii TaxID=68878 RepID=UPI0022EC2A06|nr:uncharacterized protein LOC128270799 [Anopheles cruzii]